jgi:hypothetical protein
MRSFRLVGPEMTNGAERSREVRGTVSSPPPIGAEYRHPRRRCDTKWPVQMLRTAGLASWAVTDE